MRMFPLFFKRSLSAWMPLMACVSVLFASCCHQSACNKPAEALQPVSFEKVRLEDNFWLPRLKTQKETLVPFSLEKTEPAVENMRIVAQYLKTGKQSKMHPLARYVASDLFKVMEGAAYLLTLEDDPELEKQMDEIIDVIAQAQARMAISMSRSASRRRCIKERPMERV